MVVRVKIKGLDKVLSNLNKEIKDIKGKTYAGLLEAGLIVQAESQKRVPIEYGKLRASAYTIRGTKLLSVVIGYSAAYALYVHENLEQKLKGKPRKSGTGVYWGPAGEPQFLVRALRDKKSQAVEAVRNRAKVGK